jgi:hypothetical protein
METQTDTLKAVTQDTMEGLELVARNHVHSFHSQFRERIVTLVNSFEKIAVRIASFEEARWLELCGISGVTKMQVLNCFDPQSWIAGYPVAIERFYKE